MSDFIVKEENRKKLAKYIKKCREARGLGLNQLALKAGLQKTILSRLESGKILKINPFFLRELAEALSVSSIELYKIVGYLEESEVKISESSNLECFKGYRAIPVYNSISAGVGLEDPSEFFEFIQIPKTKEFSGDIFAVRVNGDSMEYTIENGAIAFIRKGVEVENKKIGAFILNNKAYLKRYMVNEDGVFLRSDNREYADIKVEEGDNFVIVGKYIGGFIVEK